LELLAQVILTNSTRVLTLFLHESTRSNIQNTKVIINPAAAFTVANTKQFPRIRAKFSNDNDASHRSAAVAVPATPAPTLTQCEPWRIPIFLADVPSVLVWGGTQVAGVVACGGIFDTKDVAKQRRGGG
jgi:hypothetical protein